MTAKTRAVLAAALVLGFASAALPASADSTTPSSQEPVPASLTANFTPAELEDLQLYAAQYGEPLGAVLERFAGLSEFTNVADQLRNRLPDDFVAATWGNGSGEIVLRPGAARRAASALTRAGADVTVVEQDVPSEKAVEQALFDVSAAFAETTDSSFTTSYDRAGNQIVLTVDAIGPAAGTSNAAEPPASVADERSLSAQAPASGVPIDVVVEYEPGSAPQPEVAWGGRAYSGCTGAFIVQSSGVRGISTAHHCGTKPSTYDGATLGTTTALGDRDVRWARFTSGTSGNYFQYNFGQYRAATSAGDPVVGGAICKFGLASGSSCDTVESKGHCVTYSNWPTFCGIFRTVNENASPGDSGGPWYYGNKASGVHSGGSDYLYDQFSGIGSLALLGVTVVTS